MARETGISGRHVAAQLAGRRDALVADATVAVAGLAATLTAAGISHDIQVDPSDPDGTWRVLVEGRTEIELLATGWQSISGRWATGSREPLAVGNPRLRGFVSPRLAEHPSEPLDRRRKLR